ncbi:MAG: hypothetical protein ABL949_13160 [Fimbriimonadaceae bacterium]
MRGAHAKVAGKAGPVIAIVLAAHTAATAGAAQAARDLVFADEIDAMAAAAKRKISEERIRRRDNLRKNQGKKMGFGGIIDPDEWGDN